MSSAQIRIFAAILVGVIIVGGSYFMNKNREDTTSIEAASASSLIARKHIPVTDSDQDGVPDWQVGLVDMDPIYIDATNTEPYVAPDTLTGEFSVTFFKDVTILRNAGLMDELKDDLVSGAVSDLAAKAQAQVYTEGDLQNVIATTDQGALRAYGNLVAGNIFYYQTDEENEFEIFSQMTKDKDRAHLEKLAILEAQYDDIINALLTLEVPEKYVPEHLAVLNSFSNLRENVYGMQQYFDDPFYMVMRYRRIGEDVLSMNTAINNLYDALYLEEKVQFAENETLPVLVELLQ